MRILGCALVMVIFPIETRRGRMGLSLVWLSKPAPKLGVPASSPPGPKGRSGFGIALAGMAMAIQITNK